jgi:DNA-binding response OmpR family regulator
VRILVVEDQSLIGKALKKGLTEEAFAVDWATSLADGVHLALEVDYDVIILALILPDGSGFELLSRLRKQNQKTPVLILSAKDSLQDKSQGIALGTDDYLVKPFAFEELLAGLSDIQSGADLLSLLTQNLTASSRISFQSAGEKASIDLDEFFLEQSKIYRSAAEAKEVAIKIYPSARVCVLGSIHLLSEIFGNLIENAILYSKKRRSDWNSMGASGRPSGCFYH